MNRAGEHFLARTGFAHEQDVGITSGSAPQFVQAIPEVLTLADQRLLPDRPKPLAVHEVWRPRRISRLKNLGLNLLKIRRSKQDIGGTGLARPPHLRNHSRGSENHDWNWWGGG